MSLAGGSSSGQWLSFCEIEVWGTEIAVEASEPAEPEDQSALDAAAVAALAGCDEGAAAAAAACPALSSAPAGSEFSVAAPYRFLVSSDFAETVQPCGAAVCGDVCRLSCRPGFTPTDSGPADLEALVCSADGVWRRLRPLDDLGGHRGRWSCKLLPPPEPAVLALAPANGALDVEVACADAPDGAGTGYTVVAAPAQCTASGHCVGAPVTQHFPGMSCGTSAAGAARVRLTVANLTNEAAYSVTVKAENSGGEARSHSRTRATPTALADEYSAAEAEFTSRQQAFEERRDELERTHEMMSDAQRAVVGECVSLTQGKYQYRVCMFEKVEQKDTGSWTSLGKWSAEEQEAADEAADADGGGDAEEEAGVVRAMRFTGGARCWSGPQRSATVILSCGAQSEILSIAEPETCTYEILLATPAVCSEADIPPTYGEAGDGREA